MKLISRKKQATILWWGPACIFLPIVSPLAGYQITYAPISVFIIGPNICLCTNCALNFYLISCSSNFLMLQIIGAIAIARPCPWIKMKSKAPFCLLRLHHCSDANCINYNRPVIECWCYDWFHLFQD